MKELRISSASINHYALDTKSDRVMKLVEIFNQSREHVSDLYKAIVLNWNWSCHDQHGAKFYLDGRSGVLDRQYKEHLSNISFTLKFQVGSEEKYQHLNHDDELQSDDRYSWPGLWPLTKATDICQTVHESIQNHSVPKFYFTRNGTLLYTRSVMTCSDQPEPTMPLERVLSEAQTWRNTSGRLWTFNQRMLLAFKMASSTIQLCLTPWLTSSWTKRDINFVLNAHTASTFYEADRPILIQTFNPAPTLPPTTILDAKSTLLDLEILLLEIWNESSIEYYASTKSLNIHESYGSRYDITTRWLRETEDEKNILLQYRDAVSRCLECCFYAETSPPSFGDAKFRQSICKEVVRPLWKICGRPES